MASVKVFQDKYVLGSFPHFFCMKIVEEIS